jgi:hypothetical protein
MRLPKTFPDGTKYVIEVHGPTLRRYVIFPNGLKINLSNRKAVRCACREPNISVVPDVGAHDMPMFRRRVFA